VKHGIALEALIDSVTITAAEAQFFEKVTGSITVGKAADLIVLDKDLFKIAPSDIDSAKSAAHVVRGQRALQESVFLVR